MSERVILLNGFIFKAERLSARKWIQLIKKSTDEDGKPSQLLTYENILKEVVISPKMQVDDFERVGDLEWLMAELINYQIEKTEENEVKK